SLIVARGETCYVVMNLYPYNPGHLLVCPYRHVPDYTDLNLKETAEFAQLTQIGMEVLREVSHAAGVKLGMNQGKVGGAGIAAQDRKSTRLNSSHVSISYAVFCLKKKKK